MFPKSNKRLKVACKAIALVGFVLLVAACDPTETETYNLEFSDTPPDAVHEYVLGVHPLYNPKRLHEVFSPLTDYLSQQISGATFRVEASRDYAAYDEKLYAGRFAFALPNPYQTVNALEHGYRVFGKMGDDHQFRGIILVRKDSGIEKVSDLKGKAVSFPAPTALAATMMPLYYLQAHGLDVMHDLDIQYVGSQESSIMNVYLGNVVAGATWPPPWNLLSAERPELEQELYPIWKTDPLPNNGLVVREDVAAGVLADVSEVLFSLHEQAVGQKILSGMGLSRFEPAENDTYQPVIDFLGKFSREVRPLE